MKNRVVIAVVVLLVLGAVWYFGIRPGQNMINMNGGMQMNSQNDSGMSEAEMVQCPVMGTKMKKSDAYASMKYNGKVYYFCCGACPDAFKKNPEKFIK